MDKHKQTILVVDDDDVDVESVLRITKRLSYRTLVARDGIEALELIQGKKLEQKLNTLPVILLDLNMPRMNGYEFLARLRADAEFSGCVVFVLTTSSDVADQLAAYRQNIAGYLVKSDMGNHYEKLSGFLEKYQDTVVIPLLP